MECIEYEADCYEVRQDGRLLFGMAIGPANSRLARDFDRQAAGGLFAADGAPAADWSVEGIVQHGSRLVAYGPWQGRLRPLSRLLLGRRDDLAPLARAAACLAARPALLPRRGLSSDCIFVGPDGTLLVPPPPLQDAILALAPESAKQDSYHRLRVPGQTPPASAAYGFAVLAFRALTGRYPFADGSEHGADKGPSAPPCRTPACYIEGFPADLELRYRALLVDRACGPEPLADAAALLADTAAAPAAPAALRPEAAAERDYQSRVRSDRRRRFWRRRGLAIVLGAVGAALVLSVPATMVAKALRPPVTRGLDAAQVVRAFYEAYDALDSQTMQDATASGAGADKMDQAVNLYVLDKMRSAGDLNNFHLDPARLMAGPEPAAVAERIVFGVDGLRIDAADKPTQADHAEFRVAYDLWNSVAVDGRPTQTRNGATVTIEERKERVSLIRDGRGDWRICRIEEISGSYRK